MWDEDGARFLASLQQGCDAIERADRAALQRAADDLVEIARTGLADAPWWSLQGCTPDVARVATALAEGGERGRARDLLTATASFFTHTGGQSTDLVEEVLAGDDDALFDFVRAAHSPGLDFDALGVDGARLVALTRRRLSEPSATEDIATFALGYVHERERIDLLSAALERFPDSEALWTDAAQHLLAAGRLREAAVAFSRGLDPRVPPGERVPASRSDAEIIESLVALRDTWDRIARGDRGSETDARRARSSLPTLINIALLSRELDGAVAAREIVARYAPYVPPRVAAVAFLDAGAPDDAIAILLRTLRASGRHDQWVNAVALARVYVTLGRHVEAVAALRILCGRRESGQRVFGLVWRQRHPHGERAAWEGLLPRVAYDVVRDAAVDELVRGCHPVAADLAPFVRCVAEFDDGSAEARASSLATIRQWGRRFGDVLHEQMRAGTDRLRLRLGWLLEQWAWEAAEARFTSATRLTTAVVPSAPPSTSIAGTDPDQARARRVRAHLDAVVECLHEVELEPAYALVDWICEHVTGPDGRYLDLDVVTHAADVLVCEGQVERARRLLRATVTNPEALARFREILAVDAAADFDAVVRDRREWRALAAMGVTDADAVLIAAGRLAAGELPLDATLWVLSHLPYAARGDLIRPALRRFPDSPTLLSIAGWLLLVAGRRRSALRIFRHAADARMKAEPPADDPDRDPAREHEAVRALAGYPPLLGRDLVDSSKPRAAVAAHYGYPLVVNIAILTYELHGPEAAREQIAHYAGSSSVVATAAGFRAIGDVATACTLLEREVAALGTRTGKHVLNGLIAAYAGDGRMRDALAVAALVMESREEGKFQVEVMIGLIIDQWSDDLPDELLEYERRFALEPAEREVLQRLNSRPEPPSDLARRARRCAEAVGSADHALRAQAIVELRRLGPAVGPVVTATMPTLGETAQGKLRALLEAWAWDEEIARLAERLSFPRPETNLAGGPLRPVSTPARP